ncbi:MAG: hypothetical protein ACRD4B_05995 [Acidobacteriota bacterium]
MHTIYAKGDIVGWLALVVAIIALLIGVVAFNRSGRDIEAILEEQAEEAIQDTEEVVDTTIQEAEEAATIAEAQARLTALRADIAAETAYAESAEEVRKVRADLAQAYANASVEVQQGWQEVDDELELLEQQLRDESADAAETLERVFALLEQDLRTDE